MGSRQATKTKTQLATHNFFTNTWLGHIPVPFPKNYLLGIDVQQRDFEDYGRPSYLRGQWQDHGWWYYYFYAMLIKVPLGTWLLGMLCASLLVCQLPGSSKETSCRRDQLILLFPPIVIFAVCSSETGFSEHFRYILPCFPFIFIWMSCFSPTEPKVNRNFPGRQKMNRYIASGNKDTTLVQSANVVALIFLLWSVTSSLWIYPHSLSYFNETIGGPQNGSKYLLHSNIDWGQDLRYLNWRMLDQSEKLKAGPLYLAYFGFFRPADVGFTSAVSWPQEKQSNILISPSMHESEQQASGVYAISINLLNGYPWQPRGSKIPDQKKFDSTLKNLRETEVFENAGYSIRIYNW